jgi:hypothetical protein
LAVSPGLLEESQSPLPKTFFMVRVHSLRLLLYHM